MKLSADRFRELLSHSPRKNVTCEKDDRCCGASYWQMKDLKTQVLICFFGTITYVCFKLSDELNPTIHLKYATECPELPYVSGPAFCIGFYGQSRRFSVFNAGWAGESIRNKG